MLRIVFAFNLNTLTYARKISRSGVGSINVEVEDVAKGEENEKNNTKNAFVVMKEGTIHRLNWMRKNLMECYKKRGVYHAKPAINPKYLGFSVPYF